MRQRFKRTRVCSSDNYNSSRKAHIDFIKEEHERNIAIVQEVTKQVVVQKKAYVRVFGKLMPITIEEAHSVETIMEVIFI